nr:retrovirus-related Pol polyprotein from transposon TNT 1-94 [Tanacetum cinerariifolium]
MGLRYLKVFGFELIAFSDADHAGCLDTCKSTSAGIQFLGDKLVSRSSKKQDGTAMSIVEVEYVSLSFCCAQVLWMRTQLTDYGFHFDKIPMYCDSNAAIVISCNLIQHSRTKHIAVKYHFIKEQVKNGIVKLYFIGTDYQLADMITKAMSKDRFEYLVKRLDMRCLTPAELEPQFPLHYESEPGCNENYNSYSYDSSSLPQQYLCCASCGGPHVTCQCDQLIFYEPYCEHCGGPHMNYQCQPMNQDSYNSNSLGFDQPQPPQSPVIHQPPKELSIQEMEDLKQQYLDKLKRLSNLEYRDEVKITELTESFNGLYGELDGSVSPPDE